MERTRTACAFFEEICIGFHAGRQLDDERMLRRDDLMAVRHPASLFADLSALLVDGTIRNESDESLLRRYASGAGPDSEAAFAALR